ncbi:flagellar basal body P-ring formation chaperone FlgA [Thiohalorhabdus sp.]|uniref:flagellar basal body P-ring formation chaperone FlgA n=1 Tax=Thiohalorhabdus sp. TaxID=3094134 RepID=UPI002FC3DD88
MARITPTLIMSGLLLAATPALGELVLEVEETSEVAGEAVSIGDIARVSGGQPDLRDKVRKLTVHRFEPGSAGWRVSGRALGDALWQAGVSLDEVTTDIPLGARVARRVRQVDGDRVAAAVRKYLRARAEDSQRIEVVFPQGKPVFEGVAPDARLKVAGQGANRVRVRAIAGGEVAASRTVPVKVTRRRQVVVAEGHLAPGTRIESDDVTTALRAAEDSRWSVFGSREEVIGTTVLKSVGDGQPVRRSKLRMAPDVRSGDPVTLVYESDKIRLSAAGLIRQQGAVGEVLAMENRDSGERVYARLTGPKTAKVSRHQRNQRGERR